nr:hypothetical protein [Okeania sp. SIO1H5]
MKIVLLLYHYRNFYPKTTPYTNFTGYFNFASVNLNQGLSDRHV